jgi:hypothetical protein
MSKYHTDYEIIEALKEYANEAHDVDFEMHQWLTHAVERLEQKDRQMDYLRQRSEVAANIIGNQEINEAMYNDC